MAIPQRTSGIMARMEQLKNQVVDSATRQKNIASVKNFAYERPLFFLFIATHLLLSTAPILIFLSFATSTVVFSLTAAILFSLFWIASATVVLATALFVSISTGMTIWAWIAGAITIMKWAYAKFLAADRELSEKLSGQTGNTEDNAGKQENYGQVNGDVYTQQPPNLYGSERKTLTRDEYGLDKKTPSRGDYGIVLEKKLVNEV